MKGCQQRLYGINYHENKLTISAMDGSLNVKRKSQGF
jgi:hypothetical protein